MSKNMGYTEPANFRTAQYGEHYCLVFNRHGEYVGALYLNAAMRKLWRKNHLKLTLTDI